MPPPHETPPSGELMQDGDGVLVTTGISSQSEAAASSTAGAAEDPFRRGALEKRDYQAAAPRHETRSDMWRSGCIEASRAPLGRRSQDSRSGAAGAPLARLMLDGEALQGRLREAARICLYLSESSRRAQQICTLFFCEGHVLASSFLLP